MITPSALQAMHSRMFHLMLATASILFIFNTMHFLHFDSSPIFVTQHTRTTSFE